MDCVSFFSLYVILYAGGKVLQFLFELLIFVPLLFVNLYLIFRKELVHFLLL
jgi:hypothetical protein